MAGGSAFGFMGRFGRSADLRVVDQTLRRCDLHPALVPDGVKLAIVRLVRTHRPGAGEADYEEGALLMAFCAKGVEDFSRAVDAREAERESHRLEKALDDPDGLDAGLILMMLRAGLIHPDLVAQHQLSVEER